MSTSSRKTQLSSRFGNISSLSLKNFDYLWILDTSCQNCVIKLLCHNLSLCDYHSLLFSSSANPNLNDATFKNFSVCPDVFYSKTDEIGFYFIYYYHYQYSQCQDLFHFSYVVYNCEEKYENLNEDIFNICHCSLNNRSNDCKHTLNKDISWQQVLSQRSDCLFCSRYMHAITEVGSTIYVHGGISPKNITNRLFIRFINNKWERMTVKSDMQPPCLYSHSMATNFENDELVLFGGIDCRPGSVEIYKSTVWIFNLRSQTWSRYIDKLSATVIGHSIHIYNNTMYSFFGATCSSNTSKSVISTIRKFNLHSRKWMTVISGLSYTTFRGLVFHSTYHDGSTIWIYGGLYINADQKLIVSNTLYSFSLPLLEWKQISNNGPLLYLHSSIVINNTLLFIGGITATKTVDNQTQTVLSQNIHQYKFTNKNWKVFENNFSSIGQRCALINNFTILSIGGKISAYKISVSNITIDTNGFHIQNPKNSEHFLKTNLESSVIRNCSQMQCESCVQNLCVWCPLTKSCISRMLLDITFEIGACDSPILYVNQCPMKCEDLSNSGCQNCSKLKHCGWCETKNQMSGVGKCIDGTIYGQDFGNGNISFCDGEWSFLPSNCPACNCNGHATCITEGTQIVSHAQKNVVKCSSCLHNTTGDQCQFCKAGYYGFAINGKNCSQCNCLVEQSAGFCDSNGFCEEFCIEKGRIGKYCNECDVLNNFTKFNGSCVYKSKLNFKYVLNQKTDNFNVYTNQVRFLLTDIAPNINIGFKIQCFNSPNATITVDLFNKSGFMKVVMWRKNCSILNKDFPKALFPGKFPYQLLFTVSGFQNSTKSQFQLEIIFTQKFIMNLQYVFISLFACLFTALLLSYTVYKMRQHIRQRHLTYHTLLVMERPFAKVTLKHKSDTDRLSSSVELLESLVSDETITHQCPLLCIEPYSVKEKRFFGSVEDSKRNSITAIGTFLFQSPKCTSSTGMQMSQNSHYKHSSRILIGSCLSRLTKRDRKLLLELPTKSSSGTNLMVEKDFDTSISPSAVDELLTTEV